MARIFLSYSRKDSLSARTLVAKIEGEGHTVWFDQVGIEGATLWSREIVHAIDTCDVFIVLLSGTSVTSVNVIREVSLACEGKKRILPVSLEDVRLGDEMRYYLAGIQRAPYKNFDAILSALKGLGYDSDTALRAQGLRKTLMIMPFEDLSPAKDNEWFADGMTSELIASLSRLHELRVIDWNTSKMFKTRHILTADLAHELDVRYFVEGQVRKFGDQLKVSVMLLDTAEQQHVWQESIKGSMEDVFEIQERVAEMVVDALKLQLLDKEERRLLDRGTTNADAYELYLRAFDHFAHQTKSAIEQCAQQLTQAIEFDNNFAEAYRLKAFAYESLYRFYDRNAEHLAEAERLALRAFELKPELLENYGTLSTIYTLQGRMDEAENYAKKWVALDPENFLSHFAMGMFYLHSDTAKAIPCFERVIELAPSSLSSWNNLLVCCDRSNDKEKVRHYAEKSLPHFERRLRLLPDHEQARVTYACMLSYSGKPEMAIAALEPLLGEPNLDAISMYDIGCVYVTLKDYDHAIEMIDRAVEAGYSHFESIYEDSDLEPLRSRPEFQAILKKIEAKQPAAVGA